MKRIYAHLNGYLYKNTYEIFDNLFYDVFKDRELKQKLSSIGIKGIKELKSEDYELFNPLKL